MTGSPRPPLPEPSRIGPGTFRWGERTFVMGILNVTPDSFSGDGLLAETEGEAGGGASARDPLEVAVAIGRRMVEELLQAQRDAVRLLLAEHRHLVEALRDALVERHELVGHEITDVLAAAAAAGAAVPTVGG